jgi:hypothetical protein
MAFNLADYQTVQERLEIFWKLHSNGRIFNDIVLTNEKEIIIKCSVWKDANQQLPDVTDFAHEYVGKTGIGATSWVELASTSATGRALSLLGGELSPSKKRASQTEMEKRQRSILVVAEKAYSNGEIDTLRDLVAEAKRDGVAQQWIDQIVQMGKDLAKKNTPVGKEETTEVQP